MSPFLLLITTAVLTNPAPTPSWYGEALVAGTIIAVCSCAYVVFRWLSAKRMDDARMECTWITDHEALCRQPDEITPPSSGSSVKKIIRKE